MHHDTMTAPPPRMGTHAGPRPQIIAVNSSVTRRVAIVNLGFVPVNHLSWRHWRLYKQETGQLFGQHRRLRLITRLARPDDPALVSWNNERERARLDHDEQEQRREIPSCESSTNASTEEPPWLGSLCLLLGLPLSLQE